MAHSTPPVNEYPVIFCITLLLIFVTLIINRKKTKQLFLKRDYIDFLLQYNGKKIILTNLSTNKTCTFVLNDIKHFEYSKKVITVTIKNDGLKEMIIFPNLLSIKSILSKGKKYKK